MTFLDPRHNIRTVRRLVTETTSFRYGSIWGFTGLCLVGFVGTRLYLADQIEQRAQAVGWDLNVPIFGLDVFDQMVSDSERLRETVEVIERKYDVVLPHPYAESWLTPVPDWFRSLSRSGIRPSTFEFTDVDMNTWLALRPLLTLRNFPPELFGWAVRMNKPKPVMMQKNRFILSRLSKSFT